MTWLGRNLNRVMIVWQYVYETRIAPWLATYMWWVWWPGYCFCKSKNICFVVNIAEGTGHVLPELDNFWRGIKLGEIDGTRKYVWLRTRNDFSKACIDLYGAHFYWAAMSNVLYDLCLPIMLRWRDVTLDAGTSALYWQLPVKGKFTPAKPWQTWLYMGSKEDALRLWREYYQRKSRLPAYAPLVELAGEKLTPDKVLQDFLGGDVSRLALVHIKTSVMNATAQVTDPSTYLPALHHLLEAGYRLVFVGREKMPKEFKDVPMLNYAESPVATFRHDLQLFSVAELSMTGGSGIAWIADVLNKPLLYVNSWHIFMPPFTAKCVFVPTLVRKKDAEFLSFFNQFELHRSINAKDGDKFPIAEYEPVNASGEDVLQGLLELENLLAQPKPESDVQRQFRLLDKHGWMKFAQARISQAFVEKYKNLLS